VSDRPTAAAALATALEGESLVIHATAPRPVLDRLYDDLRRLGPVDIHASADVVAPRGSAALEPEDVALLGLLATGESLREAARQLHLSTRTADRRLARARATLGVDTTAEAVRAIRR
jgi:DNA-binding NarL/FixJ family response regulator